MSEVANSLYDNLSTVEAYEGKVFAKSALTFLATKLVPLKHTLQRFNKKNRTVAEEPDEDDLKALMKTMLQDTLGQMTKELFAASGAMYQIASQMMVLRTLQRHLDVWASKYREMLEVAAFKANPAPEGMRDYLKNQILQTSTSGPHSTTSYSVWDTPTTRSTTSNVQPTSVWDDQAEDPGEGPSGVNAGEVEPEEQEEYFEEDSGEDDDDDDELHPPKKRVRGDAFEYMWREIDQEDAWLPEDSPGEAELFITQADPSPRGRKSPKPKEQPKPPATKWAKGKMRQPAPAKPKSPPKSAKPPQTPTKRPARGRGKAPVTKDAKQKNIHIFE